MFIYTKKHPVTACGRFYFTAAKALPFKENYKFFFV